MKRKFAIKTVPSTWLEIEGRRLDCGPYMSGAIEARELLKKLSARKDYLQDLTKNGIAGIVNAGRISRIWVNGHDHGYPFLSSTDILQADLSNVSFIAKSVARQSPQLLIKKHWTLITRSGSIGRMAYTRADMDGMACTEDVLRVIPDEDKVLPGYIYAYLSTKFGIPLLTSGTYGSIITHLEPHHIAELPVPRLGAVEDRAHELIQQAADLRVEAAAQIRAATDRFLLASGLKDIPAHEWQEKSGRIGFAASVTKVSLRAVNYIPLNLQLAEEVKSCSHKWKTLAEVTEPGTLRRGLRFKRIHADPEFGVELIGQREGFNLVPKGRWIAKSFLPNDKLLFVPDGTIVVASQGGLHETDSFARCQFITGKTLRYVYSEHFLRVIANEEEIPRGALYAYLRSNIAFRLLRSCATGSIQQDFHPELISELPVPIISKDEARAIDQMVRDSYRKYDQAIDCEDQARALVERAIEEGGR